MAAGCNAQEVLAVSDDPLGKEGLRLGDSGRLDRSVGEVYVGPMSKGKFAVVMFNRGERRFITVLCVDARTSLLFDYRTVKDEVCCGTGSSEATMTFEATDLQSLLAHTQDRSGIANNGWVVRDLWRHTNNGTLGKGGSITQVVPASDVVMFTLTPTTNYDA